MVFNFSPGFLSAHFLSSKAHKGVMGLGRRLWALKVNPGQEARWENWRGWLMAAGGWETNAHCDPSQSVERELPIVDIAGRSLTEGLQNGKTAERLGPWNENDSHVALSYAQISR